METNDTMDLEQAAAYLKASKRRVQQLAADGDLPGAKIGRAWIFQRAEVAAYLDCQVKAQTEGRRSPQEIKTDAQ